MRVDENTLLVHGIRCAGSFSFLDEAPIPSRRPTSGKTWRCAAYVTLRGARIGSQSTPRHSPSRELPGIAVDGRTSAARTGSVSAARVDPRRGARPPLRGRTRKAIRQGGLLGRRKAVEGRGGSSRPARCVNVHSFLFAAGVLIRREEHRSREAIDSRSRRTGLVKRTSGGGSSRSRLGYAGLRDARVGPLAGSGPRSSRALASALLAAAVVLLGWRGGERRAGA